MLKGGENAGSSGKSCGVGSGLSALALALMFLARLVLRPVVSIARPQTSDRTDRKAI
jgi:hypothetical protein